MPVPDTVFCVVIKERRKEEKEVGKQRGRQKKRKEEWAYEDAGKQDKNTICNYEDFLGSYPDCATY